MSLTVVCKLDNPPVANCHVLFLKVIGKLKVKTEADVIPKLPHAKIIGLLTMLIKDIENI